MKVKSALANALLVVISVGIALAGVEIFLRVWATLHEPPPAAYVAVPSPTTNFDADVVIPPEVIAAAKSRIEVLSMPESWKQRPAQVAGATYAYYWQDVLHVYNAEGMRWAAPYPEKRNDVYRVLVVGDSLTYGHGLAEEWTFTGILNRWMDKQFRIEFLNLGHNGYQSEDILKVIKDHIPTLKPDLILYTVCLNDFLPSNVGQYSDTTAYAFPLPDSVKKFLIENTRTGALMNDLYDGTLRRLHLRMDFFDDILADFDGYQKRFARDVAEMNRAALAAGLPPLVAMVIDQYPAYGWKGYQIAMVAEAALASAGAVVIPTEDYYRRYNGQQMAVSRWEGHPNEVANAIWATMISKALRNRPDLEPFKR